MQVTLTVTEGPHAGRVFTFREHDNFIVGRGKHAHFRLPIEDKYFSRVHFMVEVNPPQCRLVDMGSRNGTHVNGQRVNAADLKDGDVIKGGKTVMRLAVQYSDTDMAGVLETIPPAQLASVLPKPAQPLKSTETYVFAESRKTSAPASAPCVVCGGTASSAKRSSGLKLPNICAACEAEIAHQPQPIDGYAIVRKLGGGGMGVVYLAVREAEGTLTALKTIIPQNAGSRRDVELFLREAKILSELAHPNIVAFHEMGECNGQLYFTMDYVRGTDAAALLKSHGPLPIGRAVRLVCHMLEALDYAHAKRFVHRDIKPANLLVTTAPSPSFQGGGREGEIAKLADFGLSRVYQASRLSGLTLTGNVAGTVHFMAPEQITNYRDSKPPVDLYAAGASLYHLLTGRFVYDFEGCKKHHLLMILQDEPVPIQSRRKSIPAELAAVIHRSIEKDPNDRFANAESMRGELLPFQGSK